VGGLKHRNLRGGNVQLGAKAETDDPRNVR
jgi:hypothetical protein